MGAMKARHIYALALVVPGLVPGARWLSSPGEEARPSPVHEVLIDAPDTYWTQRDFVEMTPPIRFPSADGREHTTVWLRLPPGASLTVRWRPDGTASLVVPPGTVADRADLADGTDPASVVDVRGTRFEDQGREVFHVLHRAGPELAGDLAGFEWGRGDTDAMRLVTERMVDRMARARGLGREDAADDPELEQFARLDDCASCHVHDKPERRGHESAAPRDPSPNRGTDTQGLYAIATVLQDSAPLETSRALDMNVDDPFVVVTCEQGARARLVRRPRSRRYVCDDGGVPRGELDLKAAMQAGDPHARAVCQSRAYLFARMAPEARLAFADAFAECHLETEGRP
jgi:hypothetical protein